MVFPMTQESGEASRPRPLAPLTPPLRDGGAIDHFVTVRDWLRHGVSRFSAEGLVFGHGTATALDEAAYLILHALHLPIDSIEPWLDARLAPAERAQIAALFERRVATRKPAPYLTGEAWMHGVRFFVDERVIVPRSFIGDLLQGGLPAVVSEPENVATVLDLCTGSGCLAVLAARAFAAAQIDATDLSADALAVAQRNVADHGLEWRVRLIESDLFDRLDGERYDLILANPPYVSDAAIAAFPPEYKSEPKIAHAGGPDGLAIVRRILAEAGRHLAPGGHLVVEVGTGGPTLAAEFADLPFLWLDTELSEGEVFAVPAEALPGFEAAPKVKLSERVRASRKS